MTSNQICSDALRELRLEQGLSKPELAAKSGVPVSVIYRLENGQTTRPFMSTVRLLAKALRVEPRDLLASTDAVS